MRKFLFWSGVDTGVETGVDTGVDIYIYIYIWVAYIYIDTVVGPGSTPAVLALGVDTGVDTEFM